jgi:biopolymer transport protein ExbD
MARRSKEPEEINAGSMADIAFLLLIFFLVTTTMDQDSGILRLLPPPLTDEVPPPPVKQKNVYEVLVNAYDQLLVEGGLMDITDLKEGTKEFLTNPMNNPDMPIRNWIRLSDCRSNVSQMEAIVASDPKNSGAKQQLKKWKNKLITCEQIGDYKELPGSAVISLQNDNGTSYDMYIQVQNELQAAINELREELAQDKFGVTYHDLDAIREEDKARIIAIRQMYPQRVSEAEPKDTGN